MVDVNPIPSGEEIAEGFGKVAGDILGALLAAVPPILREIIPALIESMKTSLSIIAEEVKENLLPITTWITFLVLLYLGFIGVKYRMIGAKVTEVSI